jgi:hypothetical protein
MPRRDDRDDLRAVARTVKHRRAGRSKLTSQSKAISRFATDHLADPLRHALPALGIGDDADLAAGPGRATVKGEISEFESEGRCNRATSFDLSPGSSLR